jgi:nicotinamide riboside kinase
MDMPYLYVIIEGAQSTGKSTLLNQLKTIYPDADIVCEVARDVIKN